MGNTKSLILLNTDNSVERNMWCDQIVVIWNWAIHLPEEYFSRTMVTLYLLYRVAVRIKRRGEKRNYSIWKQTTQSKLSIRLFFYYISANNWGHPRWLSDKKKILLLVQEKWVQSLGREDPLEKEMATHSHSCLENPMDRESRWATVHGVTKELDTT